ncbi:MAG: YdcF family protein [Firmicutes bacterium]|nr:YdcF family protein [Bacillota bacterium]
MKNVIKNFLIAVDIFLLLNAIWLLTQSLGISNTFWLNLALIFGVTVYIFWFDKLINIKWLNFLIIFGATIYIGLGIFAVIYGRFDTTTFTEDVAIVLGAGVTGEEVLPTLRNRLDVAVKYHEQNPNATFIVSGGLGDLATITEAAAMTRYLVENGVPESQIIQEGRSHSTYQNMVFSQQILQDNFDNPQVVIITSDFHIFRAINFTRIVGINNATHIHANTPPLSFPGAFIREVAAIIKMWIIGT